MLLRRSSAVAMKTTGFIPASCTYLHLYLSVSSFSDSCIYTKLHTILILGGHEHSANKRGLLIELNSTDATSMWGPIPMPNTKAHLLSGYCHWFLLTAAFSDTLNSLCTSVCLFSIGCPSMRTKITDVFHRCWWVIHPHMTLIFLTVLGESNFFTFAKELHIPSKHSFVKTFPMYHTSLMGCQVFINSQGQSAFSGPTWASPLNEYY